MGLIYNLVEFLQDLIKVKGYFFEINYDILLK